MNYSNQYETEGGNKSQTVAMNYSNQYGTEGGSELQ